MHYVIIGNGVAGVEAAHTLRARHDPERARITLISKESDYFFSRTALMYAYMEDLDRRDMEPYERGSYERQSIELVRDEVVDLDASSKTLTLAEGGSMSWDKLLLAVGATPRLVPFEGLDRVEEGVVHFVSMQDLDECERLTWSTEQAVVVGGGLIGIELTECFLHHGLETTLLVREPYYWPAALTEPEGELVTAHIRDHGVDLRHEEELAEILVDDRGRVRAVRTDEDEEIPCQMLGICIGVAAHTEWLEGCQTPPETGRGICVGRDFRTSLEDVWAAGDCVEIEQGEGEDPIIETIWYSARRHGRLAAQSMLGDQVRYEPPLFYNSSKFFDLEYTTVGDVTGAPEGARAIWRKMPDEPISQRLVFLPEQGRRVVGFNMLGSRWNHRLLERWIHERRDVDWVLEHLEQAQFDVEFGRVPLEKMTEKEVSS